MASLLVALTLTPALCYVLFKGEIKQQSRGESWLVKRLKRLYEPMLGFAIRCRRSVLGIASAATLFSLLLASTFGTSFLPSFNEGTFTVFLFAPPGTSLEESNRLATNVEQQLTLIEGVETVARRTGRAERDEHAEPVSSSEIEVTIGEHGNQADIRRDIDKILGAIPGITTMVGQLLTLL